MILSGYAGADLWAGAVLGGVRQGGGHLPHLALPLQAAAQPWHARQQIHQGPDVSQCFSGSAGSGINIPDPGSWFLPIPDPGSRISDPGSKNSNKREGWKKNCCHTFLCSHKFHKIEHYFSFEVQKKNIWADFQRIIELFTQKIVTKLSKIWVWDPGSGIRDPENTYSRSRIPDPGVKKAPDPDPQHCFWYCFLL